MPPDLSGSGTAQSSGLERTASEPPKPVRHAVRLLWISLAIGAAVPLLSGSLLRVAQASAPYALVGLAGYAAALGLSAAFIVGIARGRNWVRLLVAVFVPLGFISSVVWPPPWLLSANWRSAAFVITYALQATAVWLIFVRDARPWYRRHREESAAGL
jgi:hypothetical protein